MERWDTRLPVGGPQRWRLAGLVQGSEEEEEWEEEEGGGGGGVDADGGGPPQAPSGGAGGGAGPMLVSPRQVPPPSSSGAAAPAAAAASEAPMQLGSPAGTPRPPASSSAAAVPSPLWQQPQPQPQSRPRRVQQLTPYGMPLELFESLLRANLSLAHRVHLYDREYFRSATQLGCIGGFSSSSAYTIQHRLLISNHYVSRGLYPPRPRLLQVHTPRTWLP
jgi:hypothetical protein